MGADALNSAQVVRRSREELLDKIAIAYKAGVSHELSG